MCVCFPCFLRIAEEASIRQILPLGAAHGLDVALQPPQSMLRTQRSRGLVTLVPLFIVLLHVGSACCRRGWHQVSKQTAALARVPAVALANLCPATAGAWWLIGVSRAWTTSWTR